MQCLEQPQEINYLFVVALQKYLLGELKEGVVAKDVYALALEKIREDRPDLETCFMKTLGFGVRSSMSYSDTLLLLNYRPVIRWVSNSKIHLIRLVLNASKPSKPT